MQYWSVASSVCLEHYYESWYCRRIVEMPIVSTQWIRIHAHINYYYVFTQHPVEVGSSRKEERAEKGLTQLINQQGRKTELGIRLTIQPPSYLESM